MQKARSQETLRRALPPTACRHTVSGSVSLAVRRAFHLSLTVLVHYRSRTSILALEGGPPGFRQGFTCPAVLRYRSHKPGWCFVYRTLTLSRGAFQPTSTTLPAIAGYAPHWPYNPREHAPWFRLVPFRSPLLRESRLISFPRGT